MVRVSQAHVLAADAIAGSDLRFEPKPCRDAIGVRFFGPDKEVRPLRCRLPRGLSPALAKDVDHLQTRATALGITRALDGSNASLSPSETTTSSLACQQTHNRPITSHCRPAGIQVLPCTRAAARSVVVVGTALSTRGLGCTRLPAQVSWIEPHLVSSWAAGIANGDDRGVRDDPRFDAAVAEVSNLAADGH